MCIYQINLTAKGEITQLPDSQKIFGTLVHLLAEDPCNDVSQFVQAVYNATETIAISNIMPAGHFPAPKRYFNSKHPDVSSLPTDKDIHNAIKKRDFLPESDLLSVLIDSKKIEDTSYVSCDIRQQIRVGIEGEVRSAGLPNDIFSVPKILCQAYNSNQDELGTRVIKFRFFVQADQESPIVKLLYGLEEGHQFVLGKRSSQGFNLFYFDEISKRQDISGECGKANAFLNLGMLLPDKNIVNFSGEHSALELFTSERRPFTMGAIWEKEKIKDTANYISFIAPGSIIELVDNSKSEQAGISVKSPFDENAIVFGGSFLYPLEVTSY